MFSDIKLCLNLTCKRFIKRKVFLVSFILLPVMFFLIGTLCEQQETIWRVALYTEEAGLSEEVCENLKQQMGYIQFYQCDSLDEMKQDIVRKHAECGVLFQKGFETAFYQKRFDEQIILYDAPSSILTKMVREEVFASALSMANETLLTDFMEKYCGAEMVERDKIIAAYRKYNKADDTFQFVFDEIETKNEQVPTTVILSPMRGMLAVFVWAEALLSVFLIYADKKVGIFSILPQRRKRIFTICLLGLPTAVAGMTALAFLFCGHILYGIPMLSLYEESLHMIGYVILCVLFSACLYDLCKKEIIYAVMITILLVGGVVLCPVFFSLHLLSVQMEAVQYYLMPGAYLCRFFTGNVFYLWGEIIFLFVLFLILKGLYLHDK